MNDWEVIERVVQMSAMASHVVASLELVSQGVPLSNVQTGLDEAQKFYAYIEKGRVAKTSSTLSLASLEALSFFRWAERFFEGRSDDALNHAEATLRDMIYPPQELLADLASLSEGRAPKNIDALVQHFERISHVLSRLDG